MLTARRRYYYCPVDGCLSRFFEQGHGYWRHVRLVHVRCSCGWVGVSHRQHVAQGLRAGLSRSGCYVLHADPFPR